MPEPVIIVDYDPAWPALFETLRSPVAAAMGELAIGIEHVGSTAVPGLAAKPIIDVDVIIASAADLGASIERLAVIGYVHQGDLGIAGREAFVQPRGLPAHHLYVCTQDSEPYRQHLVFRDYLRAYSEAAQAYETLKRAAAERFRHDRDAYTDAKREFVLMILQQAHRTMLF